MTTLTDRPATALLVIDVQNDVMDAAHERETVVANIADLLERARAGGVPVIWVKHSDPGMPIGSPEWEYVAGLAPTDGEPVVHKLYGDAFEGTDLEERLASLRVGHLVVTGAQTDACIRSTLHGAVVRGYDATLVSDAHTTQDQTQWGAPPPDVVVSFTNLYWSGHSAPGRTAGTATTADVELSSPAA